MTLSDTGLKRLISTLNNLQSSTVQEIVKDFSANQLYSFKFAIESEIERRESRLLAAAKDEKPKGGRDPLNQP